MAETIKFFVLSICALRDGEAGVELAHGNGLILCPTADEARRKGLAGAQKRWREADGWTNHDVVVREVARDVLADALAKIDGRSDSGEPLMATAAM